MYLNILDKLSGMVWIAETAPSESAPPESAAPESTTGAVALPLQVAPQAALQVGPQATRPGIARYGPPEIDSALPAGGLSSGTVHEFFFSQSFQELKDKPKRRVRLSQSTIGSSNPRIIPAVLACSLARERLPYLLWIGRSTWPSPFLLEQLLGHRYSQDEIFSRCLFIDPPDTTSSLWAIETALKTSSLGVVIAHCEKLSLAVSRRFSLAARSSNVLGILLRPKNASLDITSSHSKWSISPTQNSEDSPQGIYLQEIRPTWNLELLRLKGSYCARSKWSLQAQENISSLSSREERHEASLSLRISSAMGASSVAPNQEGPSNPVEPDHKTNWQISRQINSDY